MRTIIAGSREFKDYELLKEVIDKAKKELGIEITCILSGKAKGADKLGEDYAKEFGIPLELYPAKWKDITGKPAHLVKSGKFGDYYAKAGFERNQEMADNADLLIAINLGTGGTDDMVERAYKKGIKVFEYNPNNENGDSGRFNFWDD